MNPVWAYHQAYDEYLSATWDLVQAAKASSTLPPEIQAIVERVERAEATLSNEHQTVPSPPYFVTRAKAG